MVGERFVELLNGIEGGEVNVSVVEGYDLEDKTGDTVVLGRRGAEDTPGEEVMALMLVEEPGLDNETKLELARESSGPGDTNGCVATPEVCGSLDPEGLRYEIMMSRSFNIIPHLCSQIWTIR